MPSLIQQRHEINRRRIIGTVQIVMGLALVVLVGVLTLLESPRWFQLLELFVALSITTQGIFTWRDARNKQAVFEAAEGVDAGRQERIR
jgi:hypothetical protein